MHTSSSSLQQHLQQRLIHHPKLNLQHIHSLSRGYHHAFPSHAKTIEGQKINAYLDRGLSQTHNQETETTYNSFNDLPSELGSKTTISLAAKEQVTSNYNLNTCTTSFTLSKDSTATTSPQLELATAADSDATYFLDTTEKCGTITIQSVDFNTSGPGILSATSSQHATISGCVFLTSTSSLLSNDVATLKVSFLSLTNTPLTLSNCAFKDVRFEIVNSQFANAVNVITTTAIETTIDNCNFTNIKLTKSSGETSGGAAISFSTSSTSATSNAENKLTLKTVHLKDIEAQGASVYGAGLYIYLGAALTLAASDVTFESVKHVDGTPPIHYLCVMCNNTDLLTPQDEWRNLIKSRTGDNQTVLVKAGKCPQSTDTTATQCSYDLSTQVLNVEEEKTPVDWIKEHIMIFAIGGFAVVVVIIVLVALCCYCRKSDEEEEEEEEPQTVVVQVQMGPGMMGQPQMMGQPGMMGMPPPGMMQRSMSQQSLQMQPQQQRKGGKKGTMPPQQQMAPPQPGSMDDIMNQYSQYAQAGAYNSYGQNIQPAYQPYTPYGYR